MDPSLARPRLIIYNGMLHTTLQIAAAAYAGLTDDSTVDKYRRPALTLGTANVPDSIAGILSLPTVDYVSQVCTCCSCYLHRRFGDMHDLVGLQGYSKGANMHSIDKALTITNHP